MVSSVSLSSGMRSSLSYLSKINSGMNSAASDLASSTSTKQTQEAASAVQSANTSPNVIYSVMKQQANADNQMANLLSANAAAAKGSIVDIKA